MATDRRGFLRSMAGALYLTPGRLVLASAASKRLLSCHSDAARTSHFVAILDADGRKLHDLTLPGRGHGFAVRPGSREFAVVARRPGTFLWVIDLAEGRIIRKVEATAERHYYGHGTYDPSGRCLLVTENAFETGEGRIGVYDAADGYRRIGEFSSHGIGPHELRFLNDGRTLVVANGGIRTHPDLGRSKLNLSDMRPNLAYVGSEDGRLLDAFRPPDSLHKLSIRHLDVAPDDTVCLAMQWKGAANVNPPLVALHRGAESLALLFAPPTIQRAMRNYCGSVCCDPDGTRFAVSSPRGNLITFWSLRSDEYLDKTRVTDGCGIVAGAHSKEFIVSSGHGGFFACEIGQAATRPIREAEVMAERWDNHMAHS